MTSDPAKGSWVTGYIPETGIPLSVPCRNHIYEIVSEPIPVEYGCGRALVARCLVCGPTLPRLDADVYHLASDDDIARCKAEIRDKISQLENALSYLEGPSELGEFE